MRLHRLTVSAFGPFASTEEVDFDALSGAGIFLFSGATGAGKTSVLDAVCFGLYGQVPGARQQAGSLRSDHAADSARPEVILELTLRGRRLRVTRSPQWQRPKRRGGGTTVEQAKVLVEELGVAGDGADGWHTLSTRLDETGHLLSGLLGLSLAQFCQVVLLPQGQFAEFLRADADKRRALLESLFDTARFADVEQWLVRRRQATSRSLEEVDQTIGRLLARIGEATGADVPGDLSTGDLTARDVPSEDLRSDDLVSDVLFPDDVFGADLSGGDLSGGDLSAGDRSPGTVGGWVEQLLTTATEEQSVAARNAKQARATAAKAVSAAASAEQVAALQQRSAELTKRLVALEHAQGGRDAAVAELAAARQVAPLMPLLAEVGRLQVELEEARSLAALSAKAGVLSYDASSELSYDASSELSSDASSELSSVLSAALSSNLSSVLAPVLGRTGTDGAGVLSFPPAADVRRLSRSTRDEAGTLRHLVGREQEVDDLVRGIDALQRQSVELSTRSDEAAQWLAGADDRRAVLAAARDEARTCESGLAEAKATCARVAVRLAAAMLRDGLKTAVSEMRDRLRVLVDAHQVARDELQRIRAARLAGMAAELAGALTDGHDCPVCGSTEHPRPAHAPDVVTGGDEESAARAAESAEAERHKCEQALATLEVRLAEQRTAAGGDESVESLRVAHAALLDTARSTATVAATRPAAEQALVAFDQERETWVRRRVAHDQEARAISARVQEQQEQTAGLLEELRTARGDDPSVAARMTRLLRLADAQQGLADHLSGVERLEGEVTSARDRLEAAVRESGLDSIEDVLGAVRDDAQVDALDSLRQAHDTELAAVAEQLDDPALQSAVEVPPPDLATLTDAARVAEQLRDDAVAHAAATRARAVALRRLSTALTDELAARTPLAAEHRVVDGLSRLAEGKSADNRLRMSLSAYVLAARLEQVALSASERLFRMSSGRYSLLHSAEGGSGRSRGGLALRVLDAWTGLERHPATLSGGESFSASLALALGLADVVTSEAGGALLETLFVDEGFGSLDDETLDEVMAVLDDLREGGRTVGVVSHVADLRQRIPTQLRVVKTRHGSALRQ